MVELDAATASLGLFLAASLSDARRGTVRVIGVEVVGGAVVLRRLLVTVVKPWRSWESSEASRS